MRGFTLVEAVLSMAIVSILLGAMGSLVVVASRSVPDRSRVTDQMGMAAAGLEQLSADLGAALTIVEATDKVVAFTVPDRDKDGAPDTIRYEWSGVAGGSLVRSIGASLKSNVVDSVASFTLSYSTTTTSTANASTVGSAPEALVSSFSTLLSLLGQTVQTSKPVAQCFIPTLPAGTKSWTITRVRFMAVGDLIATGVTDVQLRPVLASGMPGSTVLASVSVNESSLGLLIASMQSVTFTGCPPLAPGQEVAIVFSCGGPSPSMTLSYATLGLGRTSAMCTNNSVSWSGSTLNAIPYEVYATTTTTAASVATSKRLSRVTAALTVSGNNAPQVQTTVTLNNAPELQ